MKQIDKVLIDTVIYKIEQTNEPITINNEICLGDVCYDTATIRLNSKYQNRELQTLMHEVVHALIYERGLSDELRSNETLVNEMANGIINLIRNNPDLIEYIKGEKNEI